MSDHNAYNEQRSLRFRRPRSFYETNQHNETQAEKQQVPPFTVGVTGEYWLRRKLNNWLEKGWSQRREANRHTAAKRRKTKGEPTWSCLAIGLRSAESGEWMWDQVGGVSSHPGAYSVTQEWLEHGGDALNTSPLSLFSTLLCVCHWPSSKQQVSPPSPPPGLTPPPSSLHHSLNPSFFSSQRRACPVHQFPTCQTGFVAARDCQSSFHSMKLHYGSNDTRWATRALNQSVPSTENDKKLRQNGFHIQLNFSLIQDVLSVNFTSQWARRQYKGVLEEKSFCHSRQKIMVTINVCAHS